MVPCTVYSFILLRTMAEQGNHIDHLEWYNELNNVMIYAIKVSEVCSGNIPISSTVCSALDELIPDIMEKCRLTDFERKAIVFYYPDQQVLYLRYFFIRFIMNCIII